MLMCAFHRHPDVLVFDARPYNEAFQDIRIRSNDEIRNLHKESHFPTVFFKPVCDSNKIKDLHCAFPDFHIIWVYRNLVAVSNPTLRKFDVPTQAIRPPCANKTGGGRFAEGIPSTIYEFL